jgi:hypothetical protein
MSPNEFLELATEWCTGVREGGWRSTLSRAYYAAFQGHFQAAPRCDHDRRRIARERKAHTRFVLLQVGTELIGQSFLLGEVPLRIRPNVDQATVTAH